MANNPFTLKTCQNHFSVDFLRDTMSSTLYVMVDVSVIVGTNLAENQTSISTALVIKNIPVSHNTFIYISHNQP